MAAADMKIYSFIPRRSVALKAGAWRIILKCLFNRELLRGHAIRQFEELFSEYLPVSFTFGVSSARAGLKLALKALGLNVGDEIIVSVYNFSPAIDIIRDYGLEPVFVDINLTTFNMDSSLIDEKMTPKTKAILATHLFGQPCDMDKIMDLAISRKLKVIEDCAHSLGAKYRGRSVGTFGDAAIFSFGIGKNLPCLGGGMIATSDISVGNNLSSLINGMPPYPVFGLVKEVIVGALYFCLTRRFIFFLIYPFVLLSYFVSVTKFDKIIRDVIESGKKEAREKISRISNLQASIGIEGLRFIEELNRIRFQNARMLNEGLRHLTAVKTPVPIAQAEHIYLYYRVVAAGDIRRLRRKLSLRGIDTKSDDMSICDRGNDNLIQNNYPAAYYVHTHNLEIPNDPSLTKNDIAYIVGVIKKITH